MDLRGMLNSDSGGGSGGSRESRPPPAPTAPATSQPPAHTGHPPPGHSLSDYARALHASPGIAPAQSPHEYGPPHGGHGSQGPYASSPTSHYPPAGTIPGRPPPPPPLQSASAATDPRSPTSNFGYRHTPTGSVGGGYFPPQHQGQSQPPPSPQQRHQYGPPASYSRDPRDARRESISSAGGGPPSHHGSQGYVQGPSGVVQTPPVVTPGGSHAPYLQQQPPQPLPHQHQRSISVHSASTATPTSANAPTQPQFPPPHGTPYAQHGSPIATHQPPPGMDPHYHRHPSQPATPLGPPLSSTPRQAPAAPPNGFTQPPSPYQQRVPSSAALHHPQFAQPSPPPPRPPSIPRMPSGSHTPFDAISDPHRRSQSIHSQTRSERERSISVSPKTRVSSVPSSAGGAAGSHRPSLIGVELSDGSHRPAPGSTLPSTPIDVAPAKRKLDDRDLRPDELEAADRRPPPPELNGHHAGPPVSSSQAATSSPLIPRRKKAHYSSPPAWALSGKGRAPNASRNYVLKHRVHGPSSATHSEVNGNGHHEGVNSGDASRHTSPEASRSAQADPSHPEANLAPNQQQAVAAGVPPSQMMFDGQPFPWEPSISFTRPMDTVAKSLGDFLFFNVVNNQHLGEIQSRGVQFEIEAKLGVLIDQNTGFRLDYPFDGDIVVEDRARVSFKSSLTEAQHAGVNDWLNSQVRATLPYNKPAPHVPNPHVPINYRRRREIDSFYDLPSSLWARLPFALQSRLDPKKTPRVRVSKDERGNVLAKIVKARVADWHLWMPAWPLDCRVSVNFEWEWDGELEEIEAQQRADRDRAPDRHKNRLSYKHGFYQVDLTQVTQSAPGGGAVKEHELEMELDGGVLVDHGRRLLAGAPTRYTDLVEGLLDSVRSLTRACPQSQQQQQQQ